MDNLLILCQSRKSHSRTAIFGKRIAILCKFNISLQFLYSKVMAQNNYAPGASNDKDFRTIIQTQPSDNFQPWQFLSNTENSDNFDELLEQYQSTAGFEIVADTNLFIVKHRVHEKDPYTKVSKYDILDGDCQQYLFVSSKDYNYRCFHLLISTAVSVFTDCYKDPICIATSYFSAQQQHCCRVTTINGSTVGTVSRHSSNSASASGVQNNDYVIHNEYEETALNVIETHTHDEKQSSFDVWDGTNCVGTITRTEESEITICTTGSLTSVNKILLLGFTFYVDGIFRGDGNGLNLYSMLGL